MRSIRARFQRSNAPQVKPRARLPKIGVPPRLTISRTPRSREGAQKTVIFGSRRFAESDHKGLICRHCCRKRKAAECILQGPPIPPFQGGALRKRNQSERGQGGARRGSQGGRSSVSSATTPPGSDTSDIGHRGVKRNRLSLGSSSSPGTPPTRMSTTAGRRGSRPSLDDSPSPRASSPSTPQPPTMQPPGSDLDSPMRQQQRRRSESAQNRRLSTATGASKDQMTLGKGRTASPEPASITETAIRLDDRLVARALSSLVPRSLPEIQKLMRRWEKPILKAPIPGSARQYPSDAMLAGAKKAVCDFFAKEEALGDCSYVVKAFLLASREHNLRFDWSVAMKKVLRAKLDRTQSVDMWNECLAMTTGDTNAKSEIFVCGSKKITQRALTSLVCHEGLHNLARRTRKGNSYLSEDIEHIAMALIGDPQLVHES